MRPQSTVYTLRIKPTHHKYFGICIVKDQLLNGTVCFNVEKTMSLRGYYEEKEFFPLKVAPMRTETNFKGHLIEKPLVLQDNAPVH